jgi:hypothetical protein
LKTHAGADQHQGREEAQKTPAKKVMEEESGSIFQICAFCSQPFIWFAEETNL